MFCVTVQMAAYLSWIVQTLLNCVSTLIYPFGCSFFIHPAGWPVGWGWLLPGHCVTPIQVQAQKFNRHQHLALACFLPPPATRSLAAPLPPGLGAGLLAVLGAGGGSALPAAAAAPPFGGVAGMMTASAAASAARPCQALFWYPLGPRTCA